MIDFVKLCQQHGIPYQMPGHKHVRPGWVGIPCPFCSGNPGYHLGYCTDTESKYSGRFRCWRCGGKKFFQTIQYLLRTDEQNTLAIIRKFTIAGTSSPLPFVSGRKGPSVKKDVCHLPAGTGPLRKAHQDYLRSRGFIPERIVSCFRIAASGPVGGYRHRIIIPIEFERKLVTFQGRDITGKSEMKYKACLPENEVRDIKHCVYGIDDVPGDSVIVTEGVTDVWRLGYGAVAVLGIDYKQAQVALLKRFSNIFILFDPESQAQEKARRLAIDLVEPGKNVELIELSSGDPGEMKQEDAYQLMKDLGF